MDGYALIKDWPTLSKANAETVFGSPAWRMEADCGEASAVLTKGNARASDLLWVSVMLEDEPHVLGIGDCAAFPDLHLLWARRNSLPPELLLALVERECGGLFQVLEKAFRRQLRIKSLAESSSVDETRLTDFQFSAERSSFVFALDLTPLLMMELGQLKYLDPGHESIRALRRPAWVEYAAIDLLEPESAALAAGDCLVLPEGTDPAWRVDLPEDDRVHLRLETAGEVTFAQMADDDWPAFPEPGQVVLLAGRRSVARGRLTTLGLQRVFQVEEIIDHV